MNVACYAVARTLIAVRLLKLAERCLRSCLEANPDQVAARQDLGWVRLQLGLWEEAAEAYRGTIRAAPTSASAHFGLGCALQQLEAHQEAAEMFRRALALGATDSLVHYNLGVSLIALGQTPDAVFAYRRAVAIDPANAQAAANLGVTLATLGEFEEAVHWQERAFSLDPTSDTARNLGMTLAELDRFQEAENKFRQALQLGPSSRDARLDIQVRLAVALAEQDKFDESATIFDQLAQEGVDDVFTRSALSMVLLLQGRMVDARESAALAVRMSPDTPDAQAAMGWVQLAASEHADALSSFERATARNPADAAALVGKACSLTGLERYAEATEVFEEVLAERPHILKRFRQYEQYYDRARAAVRESTRH